LLLLLPHKPLCCFALHSGLEIIVRSVFVFIIIECVSGRRQWRVREGVRVLVLRMLGFPSSLLSRRQRPHGPRGIGFRNRFVVEIGYLRSLLFWVFVAWMGCAADATNNSRVGHIAMVE
jgi:hypothetical protein